MTALLFRGYDEALDLCVNKLGFGLRKSMLLSPIKHWAIVSPSPSGAWVLLAHAVISFYRELVNKLGSVPRTLVHDRQFRRGFRGMVRLIVASMLVRLLLGLG